MARYTKQHFDTFGEILKRAKQEAVREARFIYGDGNNEDEVEKIAMLGVAVAQRLTMEMFARENPTFNKLRFIEMVGAGVTDDVSAP